MRDLLCVAAVAVWVLFLLNVVVVLRLFGAV